MTTNLLGDIGLMATFLSSAHDQIINKSSTNMNTIKPRIDIFAGPTATIQNSEPLVTSNKTREKYGLPNETV